MLELASLRRFVVSCVRHFPALSFRKSFYGGDAMTPKTFNGASIVLAFCAVGGICALAGVIFGQQSPSKASVPSGAAHSPGSASAAAASESQSAGIESRLPATVRFYVHWRGTKTLDPVRDKNGLLRLWSDPDFAPIRRGLTSRAFGSSGLTSKNKSIRPEQLAALLPLFENELVIGGTSGGTSGGTAGSMKTPSGKSSAGTTAQTGSAAAQLHDASANTFMVYDGTGKTELIQKAQALMRTSAGGTPTQIHAYALGNIKIESFERSGSTDFSAQVGNYYLHASRKELIEELVKRFDAKQPPAASLADDAEWKKARANFGTDAIVEFFVRLNGLIPPDTPKVQDMDVAKFAQALHFDRVHAWCGSLSLAADSTRLRFATLGDTSAGSIFDVVGASTPSFESLALARDGASFAAWRMNFPAIYQIFRGPFVDSLPPQKAGTFKGFDMLGQSMLGMPFPDILALLGGEVATISSAPGDATYTDLVAISIRKPDVVLGLLRKGLGPMIRDTTTERGATVLELGSNSVDPATKAPRLQLSYVAVTPQLLIYSQRKAILLDAVERAGRGGASKVESLTGNPDFQRARGRLPNNLTGFSYAQMSKQTWEREFSVMLRGLAQASAGKNSSGGDAAGADWLQGVNLAVFPRYLHSYASGWWKSADGVYFDSYLQ
jgi:hypothetical protein